MPAYDASDAAFKANVERIIADKARACASRYEDVQAAIFAAADDFEVYWAARAPKGTVTTSDAAVGLRRSCDDCDVDRVAADYAKGVAMAPRRRDFGKRYFVGHTGIPNTGDVSNRREEHLAMALVNASSLSAHPFWLPNGDPLRFLDYQVPLKAQRADKGVGDQGVGKVDVFALGAGNRPVVVELKIEGVNGSLSDSPLSALRQALSYAAMVQANMADIAQELRSDFGVSTGVPRPDVLLLAPDLYWRQWRERAGVDDWAPSFLRLIERIESTIGLRITCAGLTDAAFTMGLGGTRPMLSSPRCHLLPAFTAMRDSSGTAGQNA